MTEQELAEAIDRGRRAAELLENATLAEALDGLDADAILRWRSTHARDIEARETLYNTLQGIDALRACLKSWVEGAKLLAARAEKQQQRHEQGKRSPFRVVR